MNSVLMWKDSTKISVFNESNVVFPKDFVKLSYIDSTVFLLGNDNYIWYGNVSSDFMLHLKQSNISAVDIACTKTHLYYTNDSGRVFKVSPIDLEEWTEIIFNQDAKCCVHGYRTSNHSVSVKNISAGGMGVLYLSESGHLWASGEHPQLDIHAEDEPKKVSFFEGRHIMLIDCGKDFNVVVAHKRDDLCPVNNADTNSEECEVFVSSCPQCIHENVLSPISPQSSSEMCPLGLSIKKSTESLSASTSTSKNITADSEDKKSYNCNSSSSTEGDSVPVLKDEVGDDNVTDVEVDSDMEEEKGDRVSLLLINTEAARQFLTRQLSWVSSGGEELLAEVSVPTRIIKQNVTTMASLVYEGVKTVGDKVVTLSRHMSGGSDNNTESFEEFVTDDFNPSNGSNTSSLRCDWSCSGGCSDVSDRGLTERLNVCLNRGARLIKTEVWVWGNPQQGQLGTGDTVKRHRPISVPQLIHVGVMRIACGDCHCVALTLSGQCFIWGRNDCGQVKMAARGIDQSSPSVWGHAKQAALGSRHSLLLATDNTLHWLGKDRSESENENSNGLDLDQSRHLEEGMIPLRVLSSGSYICCMAGTNSIDVATNSDLANEQCFLEEMLAVQNSVLKPLGRKSSQDDIFSNLSSRYTDILHLTALNVASLYQGVSSFEVLKSHAEEHLLVYERYLSAVCDVIAMSGFSQLMRFIEIPPKLEACFADRLPTRKKSPEALLTCAFVHPLARVSVYKMMLSRGQSTVPPQALKWEAFYDQQDCSRKLADSTRLFWESCGRLVDTLRIPQRRLLRESRSHPITLHNVSRFSSHWLILLSDVFVHISGATQNVHNLETIWVEPSPDTDSLQNILILTMPEETLTLIAPSAHDKTEWLHALQGAIKNRLNKNQVPAVRTASYIFTKHTLYKDATYNGRWVSGKMEGGGRLEWLDGKVYTGQFHCNLPHGIGRLETPSVSVYEGQWKDGLQNGYGCTKYESGDIYEGYYKDGLACGHGVRKSGHFMASAASVYVGEWVAGLKQGYGVMDDIVTGEKYMGCWSNNMKNGCGLIVTLDGIYYEGFFVQDVLTGHGVMVFEDGTHYEGELRAAGVFSGKGTLTFNSGDRFEGSLHGAWNEGVKITGTLHKHMPSSTPPKPNNKPSSFGKLCVTPHQKWKAIFRQCWASLGAGPDGKMADTQRAWENVAIVLNSRPGSSQRHHERLQTIPHFGRESLDSHRYHTITSYLSQAFESSHHPLGVVLRELTGAYVATYGGVRVHPLLLTHAVDELHSITQRLYQIVRVLFPALPPPGKEISLGENERDVVSMAGLLHPVMLPRVHSALFVLYALHNKAQDDAYWKRQFKWNKHPDTTLMAFLGIDRKFWIGAEGGLKSEQPFSVAVETLQQLKTTFCPLEKLMVIQSTFEQMTRAVQAELGTDYLWTMDDLFPVFHFVVVRSRISQLGSEINFIEDFMEPRLANGELGIMFTTLKACYFQILQEKISITS